MSEQPWRDADLLSFGDRLITDLQPPITPAQIAAIESRLTGPIPPDLLRLWSLSFGGRVDYDLYARIGGQYHPVSFVELFYMGSDHYRDLIGWIDAEADGYAEAWEEYEEELEEALEEEEEPPEAPAFRFAGRIPVLPFGGFEYLDRLYVSVDAASGYPVGSVILYKQGLPPAWSLRLHTDSVALIADDLPSLFAQLMLQRDARSSKPEDYASGETVWARIQALTERDAERGRAAEETFFSVLHRWEDELESGRIGASPVAQRDAMMHAAKSGDAHTLDALEAAGVDLDQALLGGGYLLDHALGHGRFEIARRALDRGQDASRAFAHVHGPLPVDLARDLISAGAVVTPEGVRKVIAADRLDTAREMVWAVPDRSAIHRHLADRIGGARRDATQLREGRLHSYRTAEDYEAEADRIEDFIAWMGVLDA